MYLKLNYTDNNKSFEAKVGGVITVSLDENPTTGFRWAIDSLDQQIVVLKQSEFVLGKDVGIGGGGMRKLTFEAKHPGKTVLKLKLWREWEGEASVTKYYTVVLKIS